MKLLSSPSFYFITAAACYVAINLIAEHRLAKMSNLTIVACYSMILLVTSLFLRQVFKTDDPCYDFPSGNVFWWVFVLGIFFVVGDICYFKAYNLGGSSEFGMAVFGITPVMVSIVKYIRYREALSVNQIIGFLFLFIGIILIISEKSSNK